MEKSFNHKLTFSNGGIIFSCFVEEKDFFKANSPIPEQLVIRSFSEILIDADNAETQKDLEFYYHEFMMNRKKYPLIYKRFAEEHFNKLSLKFTK